jgi:hypothetical protein
MGMTTKEQIIAREAVEIIQRALRATGHQKPVKLINQNTAICVGTATENFIVRPHGQLWKVTEHTPYIQRIIWYTSIESCARDIALCEPGVLFNRFEQTEYGFDRAIADVQVLLQRTVGE